jgi:hypothetical protein
VLKGYSFCRNYIQLFLTCIILACGGSVKLTGKVCGPAGHAGQVGTTNSVKLAGIAKSWLKGTTSTSYNHLCSGKAGVTIALHTQSRLLVCAVHTTGGHAQPPLYASCSD